MGRPTAQPCSGPGWLRFRPGLLAIVLLTALSLGACANFQSANEQLRIPSLGVAHAALRAGMPEVALRVAELNLARNPHDARALIMRGDALCEMGLPDAARPAYRAALTYDPGAIEAYLDLGRLLVRTNPRAAEPEFLSALQHEPDSIAALNDLGVARDLAGQHAEAQAAYHRALVLAPERADIQINLGRSLALSGQPDQAIQVLSNVAVDPVAARRWGDALASALALAGDDRLAQQVLVAKAGPRSHFGARAPESAAAGQGNSLPRRLGRPPDASRQISQASQTHGVGGWFPATPTTPPAVGRAVAPATMRNFADFAAARPLETSSVQPIARETSSPPAVTSDRLAGTAEQSRSVFQSPLPPLPRRAAGMQADTMVLETANTAVVPDRRAADVETPFVQVAALATKSDAIVSGQRLSSRFSEVLGRHNLNVVRAKVFGRTFWRLRTFGFTSVAQADRLCLHLKAAGLDCWAGRTDHQVGIFSGLPMRLIPNRNVLVGGSRAEV